MTKQPESLRLADALECAAFLHLVERDMIAAELRRLHSLNQELLEALQSVIRDGIDITCGDITLVAPHVKNIKAAIAKATGEQA